MPATKPAGTPRLFLRLDFGPGRHLGPGKIALLEQIETAGSISAAGRALHMSYRRAWVLVAQLNRLFRTPLVVAATGGKHGGGATLTPRGREIIRRYRRVQRAAERIAQQHFTA